jgi:thymidylate synthase
MREIFVTGKTLPEAYHLAITALHEQGDILSCSDWGQLQREVSMTFVAEEPIAEPMVSKLFIGGHKDLQQYVMEMLDGLLDFRIGKGWDYTYHDRYAAQLPFIVSELRRNPDTRRAIMNIRDFEKDSTGTDPACLQSIQYFIREDKLHCKVLFRSNDAPEASFMNAFALVMLQKRVAGELGVAVGSYTHRANSYHCYEKNFALLDSYAEAIRARSLEDITYDYDGFYKELMEESIPEIMDKVESLKRI